MKRRIPLLVAIIAIAGAAMLASPGCSKSEVQGQATVVNTRCPIMGSKIDPAKVPANLIKEFKGQKVGLCCGQCPAAWDKLTDAEKETKLNASK
ncbi:MAG: hypothetical protein HZA50_00405 [Planctomycetes bacterium]|nr:hypothetical protein [Planctomycetota bacterium]